MSNPNVTPFVGGAVLFGLTPDNARINDINKALINTYVQICNEPHPFLEAVYELDGKLQEQKTEALQGVDIKAGDFEAACAEAKEGDFVFLDSPYALLNRRHLNLIQKKALIWKAINALPDIMMN